MKSDLLPGTLTNFTKKCGQARHTRIRGDRIVGRGDQRFVGLRGKYLPQPINEKQGQYSARELGLKKCTYTGIE